MLFRSIPVAKWVVLFVLTRWPADHDERWETFIKQAASTSAKLERPLAATPWPPVKRRNFWVYLVLQAVTASLFGTYWYWMLIEDGNAHFKAHAATDAALVSALR